MERTSTKKYTRPPHLRIERTKARVRMTADIPTERRAFKRWVREVIGDVSETYFEMLLSQLRTLGKGGGR